MVEMSTYGSERARADNPPGLLEDDSPVRVSSRYLFCIL